MEDGTGKFFPATSQNVNIDLRIGLAFVRADIASTASNKILGRQRLAATS